MTALAVIPAQAGTQFLIFDVAKQLLGLGLRRDDEKWEFR